MKWTSVLLVCLLLGADAVSIHRDVSRFDDFDFEEEEDNKTQKVAMGSLGGALVGAIAGGVGTSASGNKEDLQKTAGLGALIGGAVGGAVAWNQKSDEEAEGEVEKKDDVKDKADESESKQAENVDSGENEEPDEKEIVSEPTTKKTSGVQLKDFSYGVCEERFQVDTKKCPGLPGDTQVVDRFADVTSSEMKILSNAFKPKKARHAMLYSGLGGTDNINGGKVNRIMRNVVNRAKANIAFACKTPNSPCQAEGVSEGSIESSLGLSKDCPAKLALGTNKFGHDNGMLGRWVQIAQSFQDTDDALFLGDSRLLGAAVVVCSRVASFGAHGKRFKMDTKESAELVKSYLPAIQRASKKIAQAEKNYEFAVKTYLAGKKTRSLEEETGVVVRVMMTEVGDDLDDVNTVEIGDETQLSKLIDMAHNADFSHQGNWKGWWFCSVANFFYESEDYDAATATGLLGFIDSVYGMEHPPNKVGSLVGTARTQMIEKRKMDWWWHLEMTLLNKAPYALHDFLGKHHSVETFTWKEFWDRKSFPGFGFPDPHDAEQDQLPVYQPPAQRDALTTGLDPWGEPAKGSSTAPVGTQARTQTKWLADIKKFLKPFIDSIDSATMNNAAGCTLTQLRKAMRRSNKMAFIGHPSSFFFPGRDGAAMFWFDMEPTTDPGTPTWLPDFGANQGLEATMIESAKQKYPQQELPFLDAAKAILDLYCTKSGRRYYPKHKKSGKTLYQSYPNIYNDVLALLPGKPKGKSATKPTTRFATMVSEFAKEIGERHHQLQYHDLTHALTFSNAMGLQATDLDHEDLLHLNLKVGTEEQGEDMATIREKSDLVEVVRIAGLYHDAGYPILNGGIDLSREARDLQHENLLNFEANLLNGCGKFANMHEFVSLYYLMFKVWEWNHLTDNKLHNPDVKPVMETHPAGWEPFNVRERVAMAYVIMATKIHFGPHGVHMDKALADEALQMAVEENTLSDTLKGMIGDCDAKDLLTQITLDALRAVFFDPFAAYANREEYRESDADSDSDSDSE